MGNTANIDTLFRQWQKPTLETNKQTNTNKDLLLKEAFLRFSHWEQSDASLLAVSVAKIVYLIHQNARVPYGEKKVVERA